MSLFEPVYRTIQRLRKGETPDLRETMYPHLAPAPAPTPRIPSAHERNEIILANIRKLLEQDRKVLTRHPILKHLVARYDAVINHVTEFGHPRAPVEPVDMFRDRMNELTVEVINKQQIRNKKQRQREANKVAEKSAKDKGRHYYDQRRNNRSKKQHVQNH